MDLAMPRCDGTQAIRQIRNNPRWRGLTVYAITGRKPQDAPGLVGPDGFDAWFTKPLNPRKLWEAMQRDTPRGN